MKIITTATPSWFWESQSFTLGKRLPDIGSLPTIILPNGKVSACMMRQDNHIPLIHDNKHPLERIGHNMFYGNMAGLTNYTNDKLVEFTDLGYNKEFLDGVSNDPNKIPTNEEYWTFSHRNEAIQYINGEAPIGYDGWVIMANPSKANKLRDIIGSAISANPTIQVTMYSWRAIGSISEGLLGTWYEAENTIGSVNILANLIGNNANIYSPQLDAGCNALMQQTYAFNDKYYDYPALFAYECMLAHSKYPNVPFYSLLLSDNETVDKFPLCNFRTRRQSDLHLINVNGKPSAPAEYIYSNVLISLAMSTGILGWEGHMFEINSENPAYEENGTDMPTGFQQMLINDEYWIISPARTWNSNLMYWNLAMQHISLYKDIFEETNYWWEQPDFEYKGNYRNGINKTIPYCKYNKEPIVLVKYNNNRSKAVVIVYNPWESNNLKSTPVKIYFDEVNNGIFNVNGSKAEIYKVEF